MAAEGRLTAAGRRNGRRWGMALVAVGAVLLAGSAAFFGYQSWVDRRYEPAVQIPVAPVLPPPAELAALLTPTPEAPSSAPTPTATAAPPADAPAAASIGVLSEVYAPGGVPPQAWANPLWAPERTGTDVAGAFVAVADLDLPAAGLAPAAFVRIPAIGLEAATVPLDTFPHEGGLKYESPVFDLGIIPGHTSPGEVGNTWLFGHLESPIRGEGAVFRDLPRVHDFLRRGEPVYVIIDSADGSFLYQATRFEIMPEEAMHFWGSDGRTATLVCSWPRFQYDERVVVTAELVGARLSG